MPENLSTIVNEKIQYVSEAVKTRHMSEGTGVVAMLAEIVTQLVDLNQNISHFIGAQVEVPKTSKAVAKTNAVKQTSVIAEIVDDVSDAISDVAEAVSDVVEMITLGK